jgi:guanylate kinase
MFREGLLVVVSGPSGTGKGTLVKLIRERNENIRISVSATTRPPREGEKDNESYFFKTLDEFKEMICKDELVEWVEYCDNFYGTPRKYIEECKEKGLDVILEIEVKGAQNIKNKFPDSVMVFILPPSFDELEKRITGRGTEEPSVIAKRLSKARKEIDFISKYDYIIINNDLENAVNEVNSILKAEKLRVARNKDILNKIGIITGGTIND